MFSFVVVDVSFVIVVVVDVFFCCCRCFFCIVDVSFVFVDVSFVFVDVSITVSASGRGQILFGDNQGRLHSLNRESQFITFQIYELNVSHLFQLKQHSILVTVGQDEEGINPMVKVWNFDKLDRDGNPTCVRLFRALVGNKALNVSCIAVHENLSQMAIGFEDGSIIMYKGDITNSRHNKSRIIHEDKYPMTGLAFQECGANIILFATTTESVISINLSSKDNKKELLHDIGTSANCSAICDVSQDNQFVIANYEALYLYHPEGRGPCLAFEGDKKLVGWFRGYLVVVSKETKKLARNPVSGLEKDMLSIYDITNKFIAYSAPFPDVTAVLGEWGSLHVITRNGSIYQLEEKDTQTKLATLFRKNMYDMAITLAKSQHYSDGLVEIFRQYGDHLYGKGSYDAAILQYISTIGHLEPSYVIRKFLDAQRIENLTEYLQALHQKGLANTDHTTLLLNCYTKLKAEGKINEFIQTDKELNFDVETAIKVCRQAGFSKPALELSEKYDQHDWYLKIQLEDNADYTNALKYMRRLPLKEAESNLKKYGKVLMNNSPEETTELLKQLCTDYEPIDVKKKERVTGDKNVTAIASLDSLTISASPMTKRREKQRSHPDDFIHIFVHQKAKLKEFLEHMVNIRNDCSKITFNTLLELYLHGASVANAAKKFVKGAEEENKALDLLTNTDSKYDLDHAMVLTQMHNFKRGILFLYEKAKSYQQIVRYHMEHNEYDAIIEDCQKHGGKDPSLWSQSLAYFAKKEEHCKGHIIEVLNHIDKYNLLSPLLVIDTLAHNSTATLGVVKDYIVRRLQQENEQIAKDERMVRKYREDTEKMRGQIDELKTCAKIFQSSKCMICSRPLELPAVHFLCGDSFHYNCFESYSENESECPVCSPENRKVLDIIRSQEHNKNLHEQFNNQLERSADGFSVVADYFGRGVFKKVILYKEDENIQEKVIQTNLKVQREFLLN